MVTPNEREKKISIVLAGQGIPGNSTIFQLPYRDCINTLQTGRHNNRKKRRTQFYNGYG
jgi:hypothetical protein